MVGYGGREAMCVGMFMYKEETSTAAMMISGGSGGRQRFDQVEKILGILDMGWEGFDKKLEVAIDVCTHTHTHTHTHTAAAHFISLFFFKKETRLIKNRALIKTKERLE